MLGRAFDWFKCLLGLHAWVEKESELWGEKHVTRSCDRCLKKQRHWDSPDGQCSLWVGLR